MAKMINDIGEYKWGDFIVRIKQYSDSPLLYFYDLFYVSAFNKWVNIRRSQNKWKSAEMASKAALEYIGSNTELIKKKIYQHKKKHNINLI